MTLFTEEMLATMSPGELRTARCMSLDRTASEPSTARTHGQATCILAAARVLLRFRALNCRDRPAHSRLLSVSPRPPQRCRRGRAPAWASASSRSRRAGSTSLRRRWAACR